MDVVIFGQISLRSAQEQRQALKLFFLTQWPNFFVFLCHIPNKRNDWLHIRI